MDTSVWSLALRRDAPPRVPEVDYLQAALHRGQTVVTAGLVLQELLQGLRGPKSRDAIVTRFAILPLLVPDRADHVEAAALHVACRRAGVQIGTIDALLAQLCLRNDLAMLTTDANFRRIARIRPLSVWRA